MKNNNSLPIQFVFYALGGFFLIVLLGFLKPFAIVNAGERGVIMRFGKVQDIILDEGLHPIIPIVNTVKNLTVRVQKNDVNAEASSKDLQDIQMDVAINWHIEPTKANKVFQRVGDEEQIVFRIITPAVAEVVKAVTAKKNAEEIITKRTELKEEIDSLLKNRLGSYGIEVDDVSLVNISFSPEFAKAIEAKQIAEQEAKRAGFEALKAEKQAQADVNRAKGQAEAQRLQRQTLTAELLQKQAIEKWNGQFPLVLGGEGALPFININADDFNTNNQN
ncbi:Membrane protease subunit, stomatin/prohibitin [Hyella patelloides LEGE 07179]|uniref:Membrane protease subunit, stomatin/prohibitin n=1 Tax=Hyella patelloides LEGE 07179 TaxID=945734 RepID=A0A563VKE6_9CYAN|nr:prohibitin family protein [Hyella patelloides]VEP11878.1 Membrane protease subunit, stomatin/prohibitin [Hyella patelloides LEGE 07179]